MHQRSNPQPTPRCAEPQSKQGWLRKRVTAMTKTTETVKVRRRRRDRLHNRRTATARPPKSRLDRMPAVLQSAAKRKPTRTKHDLFEAASPQKQKRQRFAASSPQRTASCPRCLLCRVRLMKNTVSSRMHHHKPLCDVAPPLPLPAHRPSCPPLHSS